jgi:hypothetical protein
MLRNLVNQFLEVRPMRFAPTCRKVWQLFAVARDYAVSGREISYCNFEQAAMHFALENLALSPQCGFASRAAVL